MIFKLKEHSLDELLSQIKIVRLKHDIISHWGTRFLSKFLLDIISDTRKDTRQGFDVGTSSVLIELLQINNTLDY